MDEDFLLLLFAFLSGGCIALATSMIYKKIKLKSIRDLSSKIIALAEDKAKTCLAELEQMQKLREEEHKTQIHKELKKLKDEEDKLLLKEEKLDSKLNLFDKRLQELDKKSVDAIKQKEELEKKELSLQQKHQELLDEITKISKMTHEEAKELLLARTHNEIAKDVEDYLKKAIKECREESDNIAKKTIVTAISRLAKPTVSENTVCTISLPHQEMKGRIIGKDGRNIRTFERALGVTILIDDTPKALVISGFDPFRMYVAKTALQELIRDGRIHPTRIEEAIEQAREDAESQIRKWGESAADKAQVYNLHSELIDHLGRLKLRFSLGQNVLDHSLEVSFLMGIMAAELGLDEKLAKRIGLLHDIGKAASHEIEESHALIGYRLAIKCGEAEEVANGIGSHHQEMEACTLEGKLTTVADTLSATRPGARTEAVEEYVKRLTRLEEVAKTFEGVEKAFALQAGREVHIFVEPSKVNDAGALTIAREISKRLSVEFPKSGKIKVSVTREKKIVDYSL